MFILNHCEAIKTSQSATPMLLFYPRLKARQLLGEFSRTIAMEGD
jgi:hypothetical protein